MASELHAFLHEETEVLTVRKILARLAVPILVAGLAPLVAMSTAKPADAAGPCGTVSTAPAYTHVIWIWMENHSFSDVIGNTSQAPYINTLAGECGLATNYHNLSSPESSAVLRSHCSAAAFGWFCGALGIGVTSGLA